MHRRAYLTTATAAAGLAMAGCMGGDSNAADDRFGNFGPDEPAVEPPEWAETWDDFEDLDNWEAMEGSLWADEDRFFEGSQSASIGVSLREPAGWITRTLSAPLDCSAVVPGLAMASGAAGTPVIQLWDENGNKAEYRQRTAAANPFVRRNFGLSKMAGDLDLGRIGEIRIGYWVGDERTGELRVDDLHFPRKPESGKVLLQFNGGYEEEYTTALPILNEYDLPATSFVATEYIGGNPEAEGDFLAEDQLAALVDAGWTVGSYGSRGLPLTSVEPEEIEANVADAVDWLETNGYGEGARFFSFPGDEFDQQAYEVVQDYHDLAFAGSFPAQGWSANPHLCTRVSNPSSQEARDLLDLAAEAGGITTVAFYRPDDEAAETLETFAADLDGYLTDGDLEVITPTELADNYVY